MVAETQKKLRQNSAGITASAVKGSVRDAREQLAGMRNLHAANLLEYRMQRERHVGSRVAIGYREHIDLVDVLLLLQQPTDAGAQGCGEAHAI